VGTAHRCAITDYIQLNNYALIIYPTRFDHDAPVGGAHL
jgi:hypothetical protein